MARIKIKKTMEIAPDLGSYQTEKEYSARVDLWLGMQVDQVEKKLKTISSQEIWTKVPTGTMLTPYSELRRIIESMKPNSGDLMVDLGAAYGRMAFVIEQYFPNLHFLGLELVAERVREASAALDRFGAKRSKMECFDLTTAKPPLAPFYFMYDYGTDRAIHKTLGDLRDFHSKICVVARGRGVRDCIEKKHPWLGEVIPPEHFPHFSVYRNRIE